MSQGQQENEPNTQCPHLHNHRMYCMYCMLGLTAFTGCTVQCTITSRLSSSHHDACTTAPLRNEPHAATLGPLPPADRAGQRRG